MARKRYKPEEIVGLLRQAEFLHGQGMSMADAIRQLGISEITFYRWRKEYGGMSGDELRRLKELEKENERLRRAVSDLTLDKQILGEAACQSAFNIDPLVEWAPGVGQFQAAGLTGLRDCFSSKRLGLM